MSRYLNGYFSNSSTVVHCSLDSTDPTHRARLSEYRPGVCEMTARGDDAHKAVSSSNCMVAQYIELAQGTQIGSHTILF